jgi:hypothetical protein
LEENTLKPDVCTIATKSPITDAEQLSFQAYQCGAAATRWMRGWGVNPELERVRNG